MLSCGADINVQKVQRAHNIVPILLPKGKLLQIILLYIVLLYITYVYIF